MPRWPEAEQRGADANFGAALLDGDDEIAGHPHRALVEAEFVDEFAHPTEPRPRRLAVAPGGSDRHQPAHDQPPFGRPIDQRRGLPHVAASLARVAGRVDLDQHATARCPLGDLVDRRGAVETAPDVDDVGQLADLVALELPDEVHLGPESLDGRTLVEQFLCVVLTDGVAARGDGRGDRVSSETLRHADHGDAVGPRPLDAVDAVAELAQTGTDVVGVDHGPSNQTTSACRSSSPRRRCERNRRSHPVHAPTTSISTRTSSETRRHRRRHVERSRAPARRPGHIARRQRRRRAPPAPGRRHRTRSSTDGCTARALRRPPASRWTRARRPRRR